jgi:hypothetical protein
MALGRAEQYLPPRGLACECFTHFLNLTEIAAGKNNANQGRA